jgi:hypothetical protein
MRVGNELHLFCRFLYLLPIKKALNKSKAFYSYFVFFFLTFILSISTNKENAIAKYR